MRRLTSKESAFIELIAAGSNQTDACMQVYDCKDRRSASVLAVNKLKKPAVSSELTRRRAEIEAKTTEIIAKDNAKFYELVEQFCGGKGVIAKKLSEAVLSKDIRSRLQAIEMFIRLTGLNAPDKIISLNYEGKKAGEDSIVIKTSNPELEQENQRLKEQLAELQGQKELQEPLKAQPEG